VMAGQNETNRSKQGQWGKTLAHHGFRNLEAVGQSHGVAKDRHTGQEPQNLEFCWPSLLLMEENIRV
jgi:hypothetical protein